MAALTCVTTLLMVSAAEDEHRLAQHVDFVDAAAESGVRDVVYTSFADACAEGLRIECTSGIRASHAPVISST
ncbi:hypothetical protein [Clavibacter nebraskensis]|uniref:hypothetical protein n=1 Tax=Clavibacter nebraskensis TaxID=31963 RepID=UPI00215DBD98|nr:hypothetical protein [Clavibacter nebraskensis]